MRELWRHHGTKILGLFEFAIAMLEFVDANTINLVGGLLGPKWGPLVSKAIQGLAGLAIARRGVINQRRAAELEARSPPQ